MSRAQQSQDHGAHRLDAMTDTERKRLYDLARTIGADTSALRALDIASLRQEAERDGAPLPPAATADRMRFELLCRRARATGIALGSGVLETSPDGFGFLRAPCSNYAPGADDIYVSAGQLHHLSLRSGSFVEGAIRPPRDGEQFASLARVECVNGKSLRERLRVQPFESQMPVLPTAPLSMRPREDDVALRTIAALAPWAHGHRALLWTPSGTRRLALLARIANAIRSADATAHVVARLLDCEPTDQQTFARDAAGVETIATTFDETPQRQCSATDLALAAAMRRAEAGERIVLLLDSMSALARNGQRERPREGALGPSDVATHALVRCKRAFAAARQLADGGSLSVIATMDLDCELPIEREAASMFANKGNSIARFGSRDDFELPCLLRTKTRPEDLLGGREQSDRIAALRTRLQAAAPPERLALLRDFLR